MTSRLIWFAILFLLSSPGFGQERKMSEADFTSAQECGQCHQEIYSQWTQSMHSQSLTDPLYRAVIDEMIEQTGGTQKAFCLSCHAPVASVAGKLLDLPTPLDWGAFRGVEAEGVTCDVCHTISGNENLGKNISVGAYVYPRRGTTAIKYGRHPDADTAAHETEPSEFLTSTELCAVCHKFKHPMGGAEIQSTYEEWLRGPYSDRGVRCQDCHMPVFSGTTALGGKQRQQIHAHTFVGGHSELLKKAATVTVRGVASPEGAGSRLSVTATVRNSGAGHAIPTGIPGIREMWLEVEVLDPQGVRLHQRRFRYGQQLVNRQGEEALPWEAFRILTDDRIEPEQSKQNSFEIILPGQRTGEVNLQARLFMRLISEAMTQRLNIPVPDPVLMASAEAKISLNSQGAESPRSR